MDDVSEARHRVEAWGRSSAWTGSDPYDGLNACRFARPFHRTVGGRRALTQLVKRSPIDLRPVFGIRPGRNAAAIAHVVSGYALGPDNELGRLDNALSMLDELRCDGYDEPCWGYHFDVQTRLLFYPRGRPNTIASAFAGHAILDAYNRTRWSCLLELARASGNFFLRHVPQTDTDDGAYFGYLPGDRTPIHNANMLVCALLARLNAHSDDARFREAAARGVLYTVGRQRADGSWPYAEVPGGDWVDGFHTGYVLDALATCCDQGIPAADEEALRRGLDFYRSRLFLGDGTPCYSSTNTYPIDIQCAAQGIQTAALAATHDDSFRELARRVFRFTRDRLQREDGAYVFQRRRFWTNSTPHVRWGAAPMFLALTHLLRSEVAG